MFSPEVVARTADALERNHRVTTHGGKLVRYTVSDCRWFVSRLTAITADDGSYTRHVTPEETAFIANELYLCKIDWRYWAERYVVIRKEGTRLEPLYPLWESQEHVLRHMAQIEYDRRIAHPHPDGILLDVLKARQLGQTTMAMSIIAHRMLFWGYTMGLLASDAPEQSLYQFGMLKLVLQHQPRFFDTVAILKPNAGPWVFSNGAVVYVESGRTMRGREMDEGDGTRGQLGTGRTYGCLHLSEIATWPYPEMMDTSLMPAVPRAAETFMIRESTAQGRGNYWHQQWQLDVAGTNRFSPVFIPWFIERSKYWLPLPTPDWTPLARTANYAARAEVNSARWLFGKRITLSKEQLYWYERERTAAEARDRWEPGALADFLANYPAEPEESFQHSGRGILGPALLEQHRAFARPISSAVEILPRDDLAQVQRGHLPVRADAV